LEENGGTIMEFKVWFHGKKVKDVATNDGTLYRDYQYAIQLPNQPVGINHLEQFNIEHKDLTSDYIDHMERDISIEVPFEMAKRSNLFQEKNQVEVFVTSGLLNQFVELWYCYIDKTKRISRRINEEKILEFWEAHNFTLELFTDEEKGLLELRKKAVEERKKEKEKKQIAYELEETLKKKEKEKELEERSQWIEQHGSEHLKDCWRLGYKCGGIYKTERVKIEFPDFKIHNDDLDIEDKHNPSEEAIAEVKRLLEEGWNASVAWAEIDYGHSEAIVIKGFLGKTLIKILD
jgi:hypothetical protein